MTSGSGAAPLRVAVNVPWYDRRQNPYLRHLYDGLQARGVSVHLLPDDGEPDIVHLHWPEAALGKPGVLRTVRRATKVLVDCVRWRRRGVRVVWTAHNLRQHEHLHPRLEPLFWRLFIRMIDGAIFLSEPSRRAAEAQWPRLSRVARFVIVHGHYRDSYPAMPPRESARRRYGVAEDEKMLLFFGNIRPYKNVPHLIETLRRSTLTHVRLVVAGRPIDDEHARAVRRTAAGDRRVTLLLHGIDDAGVASLFAAADLVVLPFTSVLNSGSVMLSLSFDRPVLIPRIDSLSWMRDVVGRAWMHEYDGPLREEHLVAALRQPPSAAHPDLDLFEWKRVVDQTLVAYQSVVSGRR